MQRMERTVGYASNSGVQIAYEVLGSGERDFVLVLEWATSLDFVAEHESMAFFQNRLAELGRVIRFECAARACPSGSIRCHRWRSG